MIYESMSSHSQNTGGGSSRALVVTSSASPLNIAKSYVYQSDHSLIDDRREPQDEQEAEELSEDEEADDDESEGAFTRFHRFCWALCCTTCCCCCEKGPLNEEATSLRSSRSSLKDDIDKGDSSLCLASLLVLLREKFIWMRDRLEFAEYGNGH